MTEQIPTPRERLAEIIGARDAKLAEAERMRGIATKLAQQDGTAAKLEAELAALDGRERATMRAWAEDGGDGPRPMPDVARRSLLEADLAAARAADQAATQTMRSVEAERAAIIAEAKRIEEAAVLPVAETLLAEVEPIIAEFVEDLAALRAKRELIANCWLAVRGMTDTPTTPDGGFEPATPTQVEVMRRLEPLTNRLRTAGVELTEGELRTRLVPLSPWTALIAALRDDAGAKLES